MRFGVLSLSFLAADRHAAGGLVIRRWGRGVQRRGGETTTSRKTLLCTPPNSSWPTPPHPPGPPYRFRRARHFRSNYGQFAAFLTGAVKNGQVAPGTCGVHFWSQRQAQARARTNRNTRTRKSEFQAGQPPRPLACAAASDSVAPASPGPSPKFHWPRSSRRGAGEAARSHVGPDLNHGWTSKCSNWPDTQRCKSSMHECCSFSMSFGEPDNAATGMHHPTCAQYNV